MYFAISCYDIIRHEWSIYVGSLLNVRAAQVVSVILLIAGFMFAVDVVSPATPTPLAQIRDAISIVLFLVLVFTLFASRFSLLRQSTPFSFTVFAVKPRRRLPTCICVLLC